MSKLPPEVLRVPNPFRLVIPDSADPELIVDLFERVETYETLKWRGHHVMVGPRGSGKSMILKRLSGAVQAAIGGSDSPDFFGVYVLLRSTHAEMFRRFCRDTGDTRPFQH